MASRNCIIPERKEIVPLLITRQATGGTKAGTVPGTFYSYCERYLQKTTPSTKARILHSTGAPGPSSIRGTSWCCMNHHYEYYLSLKINYGLNNNLCFATNIFGFVSIFSLWLRSVPLPLLYLYFLYSTQSDRNGNIFSSSPELGRTIQGRSIQWRKECWGKTLKTVQACPQRNRIHQ